MKLLLILFISELCIINKQAPIKIYTDNENCTRMIFVDSLMNRDTITFIK